MTLLSIIKTTANRLSIPAPSVVVTSTDQQVLQLFALANEEGLSLAKRADPAGGWQALQADWTFVTTATPEQTNQPIPDDLDSFVPDSFFNRTQQRKLIGPITQQEWQAIQAWPSANSCYLAFRVRTNDFLMTPTPTAGDTIAYAYQSKNWAMSSAGQGKAGFTSDDDGSYLSEELIIQGLRWRWKQAKGLEYGEDMATYERSLERAMGKDGGARALSIGRPPIYPPWGDNIPQRNFGI